MTNFAWNLCRSVMLAWAACAVACAGELDEPERFAFLAGGDAGESHPAPPACVMELFAKRCDSSVCHGDGASVVDLVSSGVQNRLIDRPSSDDGECGGRTLVSSTGEKSLLMEKLTEPTCGAKMPLVGNTTEEELDCVQAWVDAVSGGAAAEDGGS